MLTVKLPNFFPFFSLLFLPYEAAVAGFGLKILFLRIESHCFCIVRLQHDMQQRLHYALAEPSLK